MTTCKHGIGASYCALCNKTTILPKLHCEAIGYDCVTAFNTAGWQITKRAMGDDMRRARDERYKRHVG